MAKYQHDDPDSTLRRAEVSVKKLVKANAPYMLEHTGLVGWNWSALYEAVRKGRNDLMHAGTAAALTGTRAVALATVLMEALLNHRDCKEMTAGHLMVSNPACAEGWQTLADIRRTMLMNDYSTLPLRNGCCKESRTWKVLRAEDLGRHLSEDRKRPKQTLDEAGLGEPAPTADPNTPIKKVEKLPVLVVEDDNLLGIVTAFDLL